MENHMWLWAGASTLAFLASSQMLYYTRNLFPAWMNMGTVRSRAYFLSTIHSTVQAGACLYFMEHALEGDGTGAILMLVFGFGYFLSDFVYALPYLTVHPADILHHIMAQGVVIAGLYSPALHPLVAVFFVVEISTPFYNAGWFLQKAGRQDTFAYQLMLFLFALSFFVSRILWLPWRTYVMWHNPAQLEGLSYARYPLLILNAMQFYWFAQIMQKVIASMSGKKIPRGQHAGHSAAVAASGTAAAENTPIIASASKSNKKHA